MAAKLSVFLRTKSCVTREPFILSGKIGSITRDLEGVLRFWGDLVTDFSA